MKVIASIAFAIILAAAMVFPAHAGGKGKTADVTEFPVVMEDGTNAGVLVMGKTSIKESIRMFPRRPRTTRATRRGQGTTRPYRWASTYRSQR